MQTHQRHFFGANITKFRRSIHSYLSIIKSIVLTNKIHRTPKRLWTFTCSPGYKLPQNNVLYLYYCCYLRRLGLHTNKCIFNLFHTWTETVTLLWSLVVNVVLEEKKHTQSHVHYFGFMNSAMAFDIPCTQQTRHWIRKVLNLTTYYCAYTTYIWNSILLFSRPFSRFTTTTAVPRWSFIKTKKYWN